MKKTTQVFFSVILALINITNAFFSKKTSTEIGLKKTIKTLYDRPLLSLFANPENCTLRPQKKIKIEWDKFYGEWEEIFSLGAVNHEIHQYQATDIYEKSESGDHILNTHTYRNDLGHQKEFKGNKVYPWGDEGNSWYKVTYKSMPGDYHDYVRKIQTPIIKHLKVNWVILNIDPDYQWCLTGSPCRKVAYLMQKKDTPKMDRSVIDDNLLVLRENGYMFDDTDIVITRPLEALSKNKEKFYSLKEGLGASKI